MSLASAELGVVGLAADVEIIVIRVVATLAAVSVDSTAVEAHETITNVAAGQTLELLEVRLLGDVGRVQHLALLRCLLVPSTLEVLQIDDT